MNSAQDRDIVFIEDIPVDVGVNVFAAQTAGRGLTHVALHGGGDGLCDVLCCGTRSDLPGYTDSGRPNGHTRWRSLVLGELLPLGEQADAGDVVWSALEAVAAGADAVELHAPVPGTGELVAGIVRRLDAERVSVFVDTPDEATAACAARAGASAVSAGECRIPYGLAHSDSVIVIRRTERLFGCDPLIVAFQAMASLSRNLARAKDAGVDRGRIMLDPCLERGISPLHATMLCERLRLLGRMGYPLVVGPHRVMLSGEDRLAALASIQLMSTFGGADFVRARGQIEITQAMVLADRLVQPWR